MTTSVIRFISLNLFIIWSLLPVVLLIYSIISLCQLVGYLKSHNRQLYEKMILRVPFTKIRMTHLPDVMNLNPVKLIPYLMTDSDDDEKSRGYKKRFRRALIAAIVIAVIN